MRKSYSLYDLLLEADWDTNIKNADVKKKDGRWIIILNEKEYELNDLLTDSNLLYDKIDDVKIEKNYYSGKLLIIFGEEKK